MKKINNDNLRYVKYFCNKCNKEHIIFLYGKICFYEIEKMDNSISILEIGDIMQNFGSKFYLFKFICGEQIVLKFIDDIYKGTYLYYKK